MIFLFLLTHCCNCLRLSALWCFSSCIPPWRKNLSVILVAPRHHFSLQNPSCLQARCKNCNILVEDLWQIEVLISDVNWVEWVLPKRRRMRTSKDMTTTPSWASSILLAHLLALLFIWVYKLSDFSGPQLSNSGLAVFDAIYKQPKPVLYWDQALYYIFAWLSSIPTAQELSSIIFPSCRSFLRDYKASSSTTLKTHISKKHKDLIQHPRLESERGAFPDDTLNLSVPGDERSEFSTSSCSLLAVMEESLTMCEWCYCKYITSSNREMMNHVKAAHSITTVLSGSNLCNARVQWTQGWV